MDEVERVNPVAYRLCNINDIPHFRSMLAVIECNNNFFANPGNREEFETTRAIEIGRAIRNLNKYLEHYPTDPSSEMPSSFCASTANSIGSCCSTSRAKPLTISATAASESSPRCRA